jgi:hypothetical protein
MKNQSNSWKISLAVFSVSAGVWVGTNWNAVKDTLGGQAFAAGLSSSSASVTAVPGTAEDPVVTKSYVDQRLAELGLGNGSSGDAPAATSTEAPTPTPTGAPAAEGSGGSSTDSGTETAGAIKVINVPAGKTLLAADGAEVVVRAGKAVAYSPDSNGIADVTDGIDIKSGSSVPQNHLILFPRGGRGISSAPGMKTGLTVMVKGGYEIKIQP